MLAFLRESTDQKIGVRVPDDPRVHCIEHPLTVDTYNREGGDTLTHSVWRYDTESEAQKLARLYMEALTDQVQCEEGSSTRSTGAYTKSWTTFSRIVTLARGS